MAEYTLDEFGKHWDAVRKAQKGAPVVKYLTPGDFVLAEALERSRKTDQPFGNTLDAVLQEFRAAPGRADDLPSFTMPRAAISPQPLDTPPVGAQNCRLTTVD